MLAEGILFLPLRPVLPLRARRKRTNFAVGASLLRTERDEERDSRGAGTEPPRPEAHSKEADTEYDSHSASATKISCKNSPLLLQAGHSRLGTAPWQWAGQVAQKDRVSRWKDVPYPLCGVFSPFQKFFLNL